MSAEPWARIPPRPDLLVPARPDLFLRPVSAPPRWVRTLRGRRLVAIYLVLAVAAGSAAFGAKRATQHGAYSFLASSAGQPYRWNPCAPIHYVIDLDSAPLGALHDVMAAASRVEAATGIRLIYDGSTDDPPRRTGTPINPDGTGSGGRQS